MRSPRSRVLVLAIAGLSLGGCSLHFTPEVVEPPLSALPRVPVAGSVEVSAGKADQKGRTQSVDPFSVELDYQEFSDVAADQLREALSRQGTPVATGAPKRLQIVVMYVNILRTAGSFSCLIDYRVTMGDRTVRGLQVREASWKYDTSCLTALAHVGTETLHDPTVAKYLAADAAPVSADRGPPP